MRFAAPALLLPFALLLAACTKSDASSSSGAASADPPAASTGTTTPAAKSADPAALASATASAAAASAAPSATAPASAITATTAATAGTASGKAPSTASAAASASASPAAAAECGTKPLPDCPLQAWMKANANPPTMAGDLPAIATALGKIAGFAPAGYTNWASIANDGAKAAKGGDLTAAKAACRTCHDQYKTKYKTEMRARKI